MATTNIVPEFIQFLENKYQGLTKYDLKSLAAENLVSPFSVCLPKDILLQAQNFISSAFALRSTANYTAHYSKQLTRLGIDDPLNHGIMMSYDFHVTSDHSLKLIEINTNASFLALGLELYDFRKLNLPVLGFSKAGIEKAIYHELALQNKPIPSKLKVAIIDDNPNDQKLFLEFLLYQDYFQSFGWECKILDYRDDLSGFDFIYNRHTDFYFAMPEAQNLKNAFLSKSACVSPNPYEYFLLADKERLIDWCMPGFLESMNISDLQIAHLRKNLTFSQLLSGSNAEELWAKKKNLFFKPMQSFGSKQTYRGEKISRGLFAEILPKGFVAQEFVPAPELSFPTSEGEKKFKYDLRFYAYENQLQMAVARIYQGQVTNLRTPLGGFACLEFN